MVRSAVVSAVPQALSLKNAPVPLLAGPTTVADVGFVFQPVTYPVMASLDYNLEDQTGHTVGTTIFPSLHRQMVMVTLTGSLGTYTPWRAQSGAPASASNAEPTLAARTGE